MKKDTPNQQRKTAAKAAKKANHKFVKSVRAASKATKTRQPDQAVLAPSQARYEATLYNSGARYVTDDPPAPPIPGKAKPKLELQTRTDANLIGFGHSHDDAIATDPRFLTPEPSLATFEAALAAFEAKVSEIDIQREATKSLTTQRDVLRAEFELLFTQRASYVEVTSQGDASWILDVAMPVRNAPTPMGILPAPLSLRVDLTNDEGVMIIRWDPVAGAKSYMLEMAEVVNNVAGPFSLLYMGGKFSTRKVNMTVGKTYAFRVAAVGGEGGMSLFCPEVWRAAA